MTRLPGLVLMGLSALAFSLMAVCIKFQAGLPTAEIVFFRGLLCALLTLAALRGTTTPMLGSRRGLLLVRGLLGCAGLYMYAEALLRIELADAMALQYTNPIFAAVFAGVFLGETMRRLGALAMVICAIGAVIVLDPIGNGDLTGNLIALMSGIASGLAYTCVRTLNKTESPLTIMLAFHLAACAVGGILMASEFVWPGGELWAWILATAVTSQFGQWWLTHGLRKEKTGIATTVSYLAVGLGALWSHLFFDAEVRSQTLLGIAVMATGLLMLWRVRSKTSEVVAK